MSARTPKEEVRYIQAMAYAWGRKDATPYTSPQFKNTMRTGSVEFATFYTKAPESFSLETAWDYFTQLSYDEQQAYYATWKREPAN